MDSSLQDFIIDLIRHQVIKFGQFTLKSGDISPFYIDLRMIPSFPALFKTSIELYTSIIVKHHESFDSIAGLMSAGVPFATGVVMGLDCPLLQIRSATKDHGTKKLIEGVYYEGQNIVLLDDLVSTGASKIPAIEALLAESLQPVSIVVMIDRRKTTDIGLEIHQIPVYSVFTINDIVSVFHLMNAEELKLSQSEFDDLTHSIEEWLLD